MKNSLTSTANLLILLGWDHLSSVDTPTFPPDLSPRLFTPAQPPRAPKEVHFNPPWPTFASKETAHVEPAARPLHPDR